MTLLGFKALNYTFLCIALLYNRQTLEPFSPGGPVEPTGPSDPGLPETPLMSMVCVVAINGK